MPGWKPWNRVMERSFACRVLRLCLLLVALCLLTPSAGLSTQCVVNPDTAQSCDLPPDATAPARAVRPTLFVGNPVHLVAGSNHEFAVDYASSRSPLQFRRYYSSADSDFNVGLGQGWRSSWDTRLFRVDDETLLLVEASGKRTRFYRRVTQAQAPSVWSATTPSDGIIRVVGQTYQRSLPDGRRVTYWRGFPTRIDFERGEWLTIEYTSGRMSSVRDHLGQQLKFEYYPGSPELAYFDQPATGAQPGMLSAVTLPDGSLIRYRYDDRRNFSSVHFPDGSVRQHHFESVDWPSHLTGVTSREGSLTAAWDYGDDGTVSSMQLPESGEELLIDRVFRAEDNTEGLTYVRDVSSGTEAVYHWEVDPDNGAALLLAAEGDACAHCPTTGVQYRYRKNRQLDAITRDDGRVWQFAYDDIDRLKTLEIKGVEEEPTKLLE